MVEITEENQTFNNGHTYEFPILFDDDLESEEEHEAKCFGNWEQFNNFLFNLYYTITSFFNYIFRCNH